jgi:hypothetical protein
MFLNEMRETVLVNKFVFVINFFLGNLMFVKLKAGARVNKTISQKFLDQSRNNRKAFREIVYRIGAKFC